MLLITRSGGWLLPLDEDGADEGYLVEYLDGGKPNVPSHKGYVSWSPKEVFDKAYQPTTAMTFGHALDLLKTGHRVCRAGWNGKGMWLALTKGSTIPMSAARSGAVLQIAEEGAEHITILDHIDMKTVTGEVCCGWLASQTDMLADDWMLVE